MASLDSAAQDVGHKVITWQEVYERLKERPKGRPYGIPRGGAIVAGLTGDPAPSIEVCDYIIDDLLDSGRTRDRYAKYGKPFWFLIDKQAEGIDRYCHLPWEETDPTRDLEDTVVRQLEFIGEDARREGLRETPGRVIRSLVELTSGYHQDPVEILGKTFDEKYDEMVTVRDIDFHSLCEHHLLPFVGKATVAYIPQDRVLGLSKIARLVQCYALRLQVQERLTNQIAATIQEVLNPLGVAVLLRASHFCMRLRGIKSTGEMVTTCLLGKFRDPAPREEFLRSC